MKIKNSFVLFLLATLYVTSIINAQNVELIGRILDQETHLVIPFASVYDSSASIGTLTNEKGEYRLIVPNSVSQLTIAHTSYEKTSVGIDVLRNGQPIYLKPIVISLPEVVVGDYLYELFGEVYKKAASKDSEKYFGNVFYRHTTKLGDSIVEFKEMFYNAQCSPLNGIETILPKQVRFATIKKSHFVVNNIAIVTNRVTNLMKNAKPLSPINPTNLALYDLRILNSYKEENEEFLEVTATLKKPIKEVYFEGTVLVNVTKLALIEIKGDFKGLEIKGHISGIPSHLKENYTKDKFNLNIVLKYNQSGQENRMMSVHTYSWLNYWLTGETKLKQETKSVLYFTDYVKDGGKTSFTLDELAKKTDVDFTKKLKYDKTFWLNNPIIKRTEEEEKSISVFENKMIFTNIE